MFLRIEERNHENDMSLSNNEDYLRGQLSIINFERNYKALKNLNSNL